MRLHSFLAVSQWIMFDCNSKSTNKIGKNIQTFIVVKQRLWWQRNSVNSIWSRQPRTLARSNQIPFLCIFSISCQFFSFEILKHLPQYRWGRNLVFCFLCSSCADFARTCKRTKHFKMTWITTATVAFNWTKESN